MGLLALVACVFASLALPDGRPEATLPLRYFPTSLFLKLLGVTLFFVSLERNGTIGWLFTRALGLLRHRPALVAALFFVVPVVLVTAGVSNIAAVALLAPLALRAATAMRLPGLAMSVLVVGAANAAALSPLSVAGIIVGDALQLRYAELGVVVDGAFRWALFLQTFVVQAVVCIAGFLLFGGYRALRRVAHEATPSARPPAERAELDEQESVSTTVLPVAFGATQRRSVVAFIVFVVCMLFFGSTLASRLLPASVCTVLGDPGYLGLVVATALLMSGDAAIDDVLAHMPWSALFLVSGMMTFLGFAEALGALDVLTHRILASATPRTLPLWLGGAAAMLSSVSSSTGVVLPLFLPMVPELHAHEPSLSVLTLVTSIGVGAHLVDASPLSTLGALCVASAGDSEEQSKLFRRLLLWGAAMIPLAALLCGVLAAVARP